MSEDKLREREFVYLTAGQIRKFIHDDSRVFVSEQDYDTVVRERDELRRQAQFTNSGWPHEKKLHEQLKEFALQHKATLANAAALREKLLKLCTAVEWYASSGNIEVYCHENPKSPCLSDIVEEALKTLEAK